MPFGLMNAPSTFQRMMGQVLADLPFVRVYLDDVILFSKSVEDHLEHFKTVMEPIATHGLKIKIIKCFFAKNEVDILGHIVDAFDISPDPKKIKTIQ